MLIVVQSSHLDRCCPGRESLGGTQRHTGHRGGGRVQSRKYSCGHFLPCTEDRKCDILEESKEREGIEALFG